MSSLPSVSRTLSTALVTASLGPGIAPGIDTAELDVIDRDIEDPLARSSDRTIQAGIVVRLRDVQPDGIGAVRDFEVVAAEVVRLVPVEFWVPCVADHYVWTTLDHTAVNCIVIVNFGEETGHPSTGCHSHPCSWRRPPQVTSAREVLARAVRTRLGYSRGMGLAGFSALGLSRFRPCTGMGLTHKQPRPRATLRSRASFRQDRALTNPVLGHTTRSKCYRPNTSG
jgi:hypothetical protein